MAIARALVLAGLACVLLAAPAAAQTWQREPLRLALERLLSWNLDADVSIRAVEGPLLPEVVLRGVSIRVDGTAVATIDSFGMKVDVWALFRDDAPVVEALSIEGANLTLTRRPDGRWLIPGGSTASRDAASSDATQPVAGAGDRSIERLSVGELTVRGSRLRAVSSGSPNLIGSANAGAPPPESSAAFDVEVAVELEARHLVLPMTAEALRRVEASVGLDMQPSRIGDRTLEGGRVELVALAEGRLAIVQADASGDLGDAYLSGWLDLSHEWTQPKGELTLGVRGLRADETLLGDLAASLSGDGDGGIAIESLRLSGGPVPVSLLARSTLRLDPARSGEGLALSADGIALDVAGTPLRLAGALDADGLRALRVGADALEVGAIATLLSWRGELSGTLDVELSLDGPFAAPEITGQAAWKNPRIGALALSSIDAAIARDDGALRADLQVHHTEGSAAVLRVDAVLPYEKLSLLLRDPLALEGSHVRLRGDGVDLGIFEVFTKRRLARQWSGQATLDVSLSGGAEPRADGVVELVDCGVLIPLLGRRFAPIAGRLRLQGESLVLDSLRIGSEAAGARLSGRLELKQLAPAALDLALAMNHLPLARTSLLHADAGGDVRVSGPIDALDVRGSLELEEARVRLKDGNDPLLREIRILANGSQASDATRFVEAKQVPSAIERASVRLGLKISDARVRGLGADLNLTGDLELTQAPLKPPRYAGSVAVVRGDYTFQGRRFKVRRGVLAFDGSRVANPVVEVEAIYRLRDVDIFAHLSGRLDNIRVRLESDPPMRDSEVLSYLMLGRSSDEALDSRVFNDAASQLALGVAVSEVSPLLETYLPIDTLDLRAGSDDGAPSEVVVGKYLSRSVFVSLGRTLGRDPVDTLRVEWQMMDHWSIETDVSDDENAGGDLIWSFDF